jgi:hypothetical protein
MEISISVHILLLALGAMSHIDNPTKSTTEFIGCGDSRFYNVTHTKYYYEVVSNSSVRLPSCGARTNSFSSYWFVYTDFCRKQESASFATVNSNGVTHCMNRPLLISFDSCRLNYMFTNKSMTIINMTDSTPNEYICFYGRNILNLVYTSAVIYLIRILGKLGHLKQIDLCKYLTGSDFDKYSLKKKHSSCAQYNQKSNDFRYSFRF